MRLSALSYHGPVLDLRGPLIVRAVFSRSLHLQTTDRQVVTVAALPYNGPLTIRVPYLPPVQAGAVTQLEAGHLVSGAVTLDLRTGASWDPGMVEPRPLVWEDLPPWIARVRERQRVANRGGLSLEGSTPWRDRVRDALESLPRGLVMLEGTAVDEAALRLLGFGPGLTPSGDDVLVGLLTALSVLGSRLPDRAVWAREARALVRPVVAAAGQRTTALSTTLLRWAVRGVATEALLNVLWNLDDEQRVEELLDLGHSSGSDMLTGAVLAATALMGEQEKDGASLVYPA